MTSLARSLALLVRVRGPLTLAALMVALAGCDGPAPARDAGPSDSGSMQVDAGPPPDGGDPCTSDAECDDGVSCTNDTCTGGFCRHGVDRSVCDDGVFCNGVEECDPRHGCMPADVRETCNDNEVCTIDRCDETTDSCSHQPRDLDMDGDPDFFCAGGGDCNDTDATISSLGSEICSDFVDNDCDGDVDEPGCGGPPHDTCEDGLDVSAGGTFLVSTSGAGPETGVECGSTSDPDIVATFTLEEARSFSIDVEADGSFFTVSASLRTACGDSTTAVVCDSGFPAASIRRRSLAPGQYFVVVSTSTPGGVALTVRFDDPIDPATNEACAAPIDVSAGGTFTGTFIEVADDVTTSCGFDDQPDLFYTFTTTDVSDVQISARASTGDSLNWSVRSACTDDESDIRCAYGAPASGRIHELPAGTYFLVVESPSWSAPDFTLTIDFLGATPAAHGDTCGDPLPVTIGTPVTGSLVGMEDDFDLLCGFHYRDVVHTFTLDAASDVTVVFDPGAYANVAVRSTCEGTTDLSCEAGTPPRMRLRNLAAGTYYVIGESYTPGGYTLEVDATTPPSVPVEVSGNDVCPDAQVVPETGGLFHGTTGALTNDYTAACGGGAAGPDAVFQLALSAPKHVVISTDGSTYDTVLHVHRDACTSAETYCDDDGGEGTTSLVDQTLDAGTWYVVVDSYSVAAGEEYFVEVIVSDP